MAISGINQEIFQQQPTFNIPGGSLEILPDQFVPNLIGINTDDLIDLVVYATDASNSQLFGVTFEVTGSTSNNTVRTGDFIGLSISQSDAFNVSASLTGYTTNQIGVSFTNGEPQKLVIVLQEVPKILFTCTTIFKNKDGVTVSKPLTSGYVEVTFTGNSAFDINEYMVTFEAIKVGGSKYNSVVLGNQLIYSLPNQVTYRVDVVQDQGDFCYLSNIVKKLC